MQLIMPTVLDKLTWIHHASFFLIADGISLYIDPWHIADTTQKADIILITHAHFDHYDKETILKLLRRDDTGLASSKTTIVCPEDVAEDLRSVVADGDAKIVTVKPGDHWEGNGYAVEAFPAYNITRPNHPRANDWVGYVLVHNDWTLYHAGDTDNIPELEGLVCDVALLPVGGTYTMDPREAVDMLRHIRCATVVPMHFGNVVGSPEMGEQFAALVADAGLAVNVVVMKEREPIH